ncbi:MAG: nuclear transport factor 2 family protein [Anaerolineales bacterium]
MPTSASDMRAAILAQISAWEQGDAEALATAFAPRGEIVVSGKRITGHKALLDTVVRFAGRHRDVQVTIHRMLFGDDCAALEYRWEDTKIETGERYLADDAVWVDFKDGRITRWREYWDNETPKKESI